MASLTKTERDFWMEQALSEIERLQERINIKGLEAEARANAQRAFLNSLGLLGLHEQLEDLAKQIKRLEAEREKLKTQFCDLGGFRYYNGLCSGNDHQLFKDMYHDELSKSEIGTEWARLERLKNSVPRQLMLATSPAEIRGVIRDLFANLGLTLDA